MSAAVTLMARDRGGRGDRVPGALIPVLDDRLDTPSRRQAVGNPGSTRRAPGDVAALPRRGLRPVATRRRTRHRRAVESLAGLPSALIQTNGLDPLRDEGIQYAVPAARRGHPGRALQRAGRVPRAPSENPARSTHRAGQSLRQRHPRGSAPRRSVAPVTGAVGRLTPRGRSAGRGRSGS